MKTTAQRVAKLTARIETDHHNCTSFDKAGHGCSAIDKNEFGEYKAEEHANGNAGENEGGEEDDGYNNAD